jgi:hypothetical protein
MTKPKLGKPIVVLEGRLELKRILHIAPIECQHNCKMDHIVPALIGVASGDTWATSIEAIECALECLNGKYVRVTIEVEEKKGA